MSFRYIDRWQESLGQLWRADRDARKSDTAASAYHDQLLTLLEQRDRDLEQLLAGGNWTTGYVSQIDQGATTNIAHDTNFSTLQVVAGMAFWTFFYNVTGGGTANNAVHLRLPVAAYASTTVNLQIGYGMVFDADVTTRDFGGWEIHTTDPTVARFACDRSTGTLWGIAPNVALANGDQLRGNVVYRVASA